MRLEIVTELNLDLAYETQKMIFPDSPDYLFLKRAVESKDNSFNHYLAIEDGKIIGITGTYVESCDRDTVWLSWFGVLPKEREKGYGGQILLETEKICKTLPFKFFRCYTSSRDNLSAIPLYSKFFEISEKYENDNDETYDNTTLIFSSSLHKEKVSFWNNKYIGIKEYEKLCEEGENLLKIKSHN